MVEHSNPTSAILDRTLAGDVGGRYCEKLAKISNICANMVERNGLGHSKGSLGTSLFFSSICQ